jgi:hypothetical protein
VLFLYLPNVYTFRLCLLCGNSTIVECLPCRAVEIKGFNHWVSIVVSCTTYRFVHCTNYISILTVLRDMKPSNAFFITDPGSGIRIWIFDHPGSGSATLHSGSGIGTESFNFMPKQRHRSFLVRYSDTLREIHTGRNPRDS